MSRDFVHLHVHTGYSLLDGSGKIPLMVKRAKELGMSAMAITDHGVMYGCVEFYKAAKEVGIKPIIGSEIYVASKSMHIKEQGRKNDTHHLVLLVKNSTGYNNLMKIVSAASIDGFYYKPRVDHDFLKEHSEGLIALSACLGGEVQGNILKSNLEAAKESALFYKETFKEGFYLELQNHGMREQIMVNENLIAMSKELDIPLVATNDIHYINKEDSRAHDILLCIQTGKTVDEKGRMSYQPEQFYIRSQEEMEELFGHVEEALDNTVKIAEQCDFDYEFHVSKLPNFPLPPEQDHYEYLRDTCYKGLEERYEEITEEIKTRLDYELDIIKTMGYVDYFLIVWDFIRFSNESGIPTGPGRGSAAGSIVAFTLGITKIDPIKYSLLFERFLNPERISMPDIDSDFCYERRQEVIDYVVDKYGYESVSQIITFGTMAARMCIRDVGRAMNYSYSEVDAIAKMIPTMLGINIERALEVNSELKTAYEEDDRVRDLIDVSRTLEGLPRHTSTHAAGVVIASQHLVNYVPLQKNDEAIVTQYTMGTLEELGLLKMDFLGLRTLTVLKDAVDMVRQNKGIEVDLDKIDDADSKVYSMVGEGKTVGVFQLESPGMTSFMKDLKPDSLEDIIAGISLYRPGPMAEIPRYIEGKRNSAKIKYETPQLEPILGVTYGVMVYQEQVMEIVRKLAGYSMGRSDLVRRAMSKKKHKVMEEERQNFIYGIVDKDGNIEVPGCLRNGISAEAANKIFDQMMDFASYAFNKSHAAAYAVVAYQTAYMMCYYPTEFIAAMLNSVMGNNEKVAYYIRFAKEKGIEVLPPHINESYSKFTVNKEKIRFGMASIKNVGGSVTDSIVRVREEKGKFKDFMDFAEKIDVSTVNKRAAESLIKSGAFDDFQIYRSKLLAIMEKVLDGISNQKKRNIQGQLNLFQDFENDDTQMDIKIEYPKIREFEKKHILAMEKEMTGLYLSGHPLDEYVQTLNYVTNTNSSEIVANQLLEGEVQVDNSKIRDGDKVIIGGTIAEISKKITRNNAMMAFLRLEDLYGSVEVIVFPKTYEKVKSMLDDDALVIVAGRISMREEEEPKVLCERIEPLIKGSEEKLKANFDHSKDRTRGYDPTNNRSNVIAFERNQEQSKPVIVDNGRKIYIQVADEDEQKEAIEFLRVLSKDYSGNTRIILFRKSDRVALNVSPELWVNEKIEVISLLRDKFKEENVKEK